MQKYAALIMDLKKSRKYTSMNRSLIQKSLISALDILNEVYSNELIREVDFSAGDEMQGLFKSPEAAYLYYRMISMWLHPVKIRGGIGVGSWDLQIEDKGTRTQDGKAYHYARKAIDQTSEASGYSVLLYSAEQQYDLTTNAIIGCVGSLMGKLSENQNQLILAFECVYPVYLQCSLKRLSLDRMLSWLKTKSAFDHQLAAIKKELPFDFIREKLGEESLQMPEVSPKEWIKEKDFYITSGKKHGNETQFAQLFEIKRQTVSRALAKGNCYMIRNMVIATLNEMSKINIEGVET